MAKIKLNFRNLSIPEKITRSRQIVAAMTDNTGFLHPIPDLADVSEAHPSVRSNEMSLNTNRTVKQAGSVLVRYTEKLWFRVALLSLVFILMTILASTNLVWIKTKYLPQTWGEQVQIDRTAQELIAKAHQKASDEIKANLEQMDTWYHYKFILIGGVIAIFLGNIGILRRQSDASHQASESVLESALDSNRTAAMLTLVCIIALIIDMHIRANVNGIQHLSSWISTYVEPSYIKSVGVATEGYPMSMLTETGFIPWETFNRLPPTVGSTLYSITYSIQLHFTTILSYLFYVMVFQNISLKTKSEERQRIAVVGFLSVHISLLAFIFVAHTVFNIFDMACFPMVPRNLCPVSGTHGSVAYIIVWLCLLAIHTPYLLVPILRSEPEKTADAASGATR